MVDYATHNFVPVKFSDRALLEMLLRRGYVVACRKVCYDLFTNPPTGKQPRLGIREPPLQVRHKAIISALLAEVAGIVEVNLVIGSAFSCGQKNEFLMVSRRAYLVGELPFPCRQLAGLRRNHLSWRGGSREQTSPGKQGSQTTRTSSQMWRELLDSLVIIH